MTEKPKRRKLSYEILGLIVLSAGISLVLFLLLVNVAAGIAETYCFQHDVPMTEFDWMEVERWIFGVSAALSFCSFSLLFLFLLGDRMAYIRKITAGIAQLHQPENAASIALEGKNELTDLAAAVNEMADARRRLQQEERALAAEKEELIRSLSHDIRTPLTAILSYSDYLTGQEALSEAQRDACLTTIRKKAEQIRDLTDILLEGNRRNPEHFENGKLLLEQLAAEFEESVEDDFSVETDFSACPAFEGSFDVQELRRVFDNLSSNVVKYADPAKPVILKVRFEQNILSICQSNGVLPPQAPSESYQIGLNSIRRIAQFYGGSVTVEEKGEDFSITICLADI